MALPHVGEWLVAPQRRLRIGGLMALLAVSSFMTPLSLDMYTPAVPYMAGYFSTTPDMVNLTLSGFFVCFTLGMLVFGPVSDRFGRRPAFVASYALYVVGSLLCALSPTVEVFVFARVLQGLGAGGASSVSMAVVKDAFDAAHRGTVLGIMQVLFVIGPVVAPLLGAVIISSLGWRASFWALTVVGVAAFAASLAFEETISDEGRVRGGAGVVLGRLAAVSRNKGFMVFLVAVSCLEMSFMAYIAVASYVYMGIYGLGEMSYSLCFSAAALVGVAGPALYAAISKRTGVKLFTTGALVLGFVGGVLLATVGRCGFLAFCLVSMVVPIMQACVRPYSTNILLEQQKSDTGSASALISFIRGVIGSMGMLMPLLPWPDYITALSVTTMVALAVGIVLWVLLMRSCIPLATVKGDQPAKPW